MPVKQLGKALKSAARLPLRATRRRRSSKNDNAAAPAGLTSLTPELDEEPLVMLRVQVIGCKDLTAKDIGGTSDPFVVLSLLSTRHQTATIKKTLNPFFASSPETSTFDFPIHRSVVESCGVGSVELVVWDKDMLGKDYLGELALSLEDWFAHGKDNLSFEAAEPISRELTSTQDKAKVSGSIQLKLGFVAFPGKPVADFGKLYKELIKQSRGSLSVSTMPPTEGVGTMRSNKTDIDAAIFEDDGGLSSDSDSSSSSDSDSETEDEDARPAPHEDLMTPTGPSPGGGLQVPAVSLTPATPEAITPTPITPTATTLTATGKSRSGIFTRIKLPRRSTSSSIATSTSAPTTPSSEFPPVQSTPGTSRRSSGRFTKKWGSRNNSASESSTGSGGSEEAQAAAAATTPAQRAKKQERRDARRARKTQRRDAKARAKGIPTEGLGNDIIGIVVMEVEGAEDLPRLKNMTRTGWDMDPFLVVSFGKKVFRTRVIRHSLSPKWNESLMFHVRRYELGLGVESSGWSVNLSLYDWDKLSSNDAIGDARFPIRELVNYVVQPDKTTGLYPPSAFSDSEGQGGMKTFSLPIQTTKPGNWEGKHNPIVKFKAKFTPYSLLRQKFWRSYLQAYDTDETNTYSHLEITSMLDSLGSTLSSATINEWFTKVGKDPKEQELSLEEIVAALEAHIVKPDTERRQVGRGIPGEENTSFVATPVVEAVDGTGKEIALDGLDFSGPAMGGGKETYPTEPFQRPVAPGGAASSGSTDVSSSEGEEIEPGADPLSVVTDSKTSGDGTPAAKGKKRRLKFKRTKKAHLPIPTLTDEPEGEVYERLVCVQNCPLCHRPGLDAHTELDVVTHLSVCFASSQASNNGSTTESAKSVNALSKMLVNDYVTPSQAHRKWLTKLLSKVSSGEYKLGANSANIIVQNRTTGMLEEEKMQVYVRLGIRLLYKGAKGRIESARARKLLKSLSIKQGVKFDSPESARDIPAFIAFHQLDVKEILDPLDSFKTFNEFFYRKLKTEARPIEELNNPARLVSAADSRFMAFETIDDATRLWIKGKEFSVEKLLLGDAPSKMTPDQKAEWEQKAKDAKARYEGGSLCIFRLAPQDYHRYHSPVDGVVGETTKIDGEYYTVNPQAIRTTLDVYGENIRVIVPIASPTFGAVTNVCVGAMMVGSIVLTVKPGDTIARGQEFGYFAFGGSTIVTLFEKGKVNWDEDLLVNGKGRIETLVRVGMGIGRCPG